jgi:hypothetical protein
VGTEYPADDIRARAGQIVIASVPSTSLCAVMIIVAVAVAAASHVGTTPMLLLVFLAAVGFPLSSSGVERGRPQPSRYWWAGRRVLPALLPQPPRSAAQAAAQAGATDLAARA